MKIPENIPMPKGMSKKEIVDLLLREEYGYLPPRAEQVSATPAERHEVNGFCPGKARYMKMQLNCKVDGKDFSFPFNYIQCVSDKPMPCFIHISFYSPVPNKYEPTEEIIDNGYSVISFNYEDVTSDDGDMTNGLSGLVFPNGKRGERQCGKIGLWAWAAMAVMDFAVAQSEIDSEHISVVGHSRLGKTALLTGALDERFYCAISNESGCSGAAIARGAHKGSETIRDICAENRFWYWFAESYYKYIDNESAMPFDQHFLLAANAPHKVYVASADENPWADPQNEYLSCLLAGEYYKEQGLNVDLKPEFPTVGKSADGGDIGYHIRKGSHYFSRIDWVNYIAYLNKHIGK